MSVFDEWVVTVSSYLQNASSSIGPGSYSGVNTGFLYPKNLLDTYPESSGMSPSGDLPNQGINWFRKIATLGIMRTL
jgi:hypothetical protein